MKQVIRLTEQDLARIVKRVINEENLAHPVCVKGDCKNGIGELKFGSGSIYKGEFQNEKFRGYGVLKLDTGGIYKGQFPGSDSAMGWGVFTNKHGRVFTGQWNNFMTGDLTLRYRLPVENENKQYGLLLLEELENIKKGQKVNVQNCKKPEDDDDWVTSTLDKNYEYYNSSPDPTKEETSCWWARNINNGKIFNLTKLSQTNPKILKSLDKLNKEFFNTRGYM